MLTRDDIGKLDPESLIMGMMNNGKLRCFYFVDFIPLEFSYHRLKKTPTRGQIALFDKLSHVYLIEEISLLDWNRYEIVGKVPKGTNPIRMIRKEDMPKPEEGI